MHGRPGSLANHQRWRDASTMQEVMMTDQSDATQADADAQSQADNINSESQVESQVEAISLDEAKKLRSEAQNLRKRLKDAEATAQAAEAKQREADEAKAKEEGNYKQLLEQREAELAELKGKLEERDLKDRKAAIAKQHGIQDDAIRWLQGATDEELEEEAKALAKVLKSREAPDTDAGERTPPGAKKSPDKAKFADPALWGLG